MRAAVARVGLSTTNTSTGLETDMSKIVRAAEQAKRDGYDYIASVVKQVYSTTYYNVVHVDRIINGGGWPAAPIKSFGWHGRIGQSDLPAKTILRTAALRRVK